MALLSYILEKTEGMNKKTFLKVYARPALYFAPNSSSQSYTQGVVEFERQKAQSQPSQMQSTEFTDSIQILTKMENLLAKKPVDIFTETSSQGIRQFRNKASIFFLTKDYTKNSPQADDSMITLGRAGSNDIVLADEMVSKTHAVFIHMPNRNRWVILDQGSTNGTQVDEFKLKPRFPHLLKNKSSVVFSDKFQATFMQAEVVWDFLSYERNLKEIK